MFNQRHKFVLLSAVLALTVMCCSAPGSFAQNDQAADLSPLNISLDEIEFERDRSLGAAIYITAPTDGIVSITVGGEAMKIPVLDGRGTIPLEVTERGSLISLRNADELRLVHVAETRTGYRYRPIPLWLSILPPLVAIGIALLFKEVYIALVMGIWSGAFIAGGLRWEAPLYFFLTFFDVIEKYVVNALTDPGHMSVIVFSLLIGGMVAIISKNGGMAGVVNRLAVLANSAKRSQFVTWFLGVAIFFDDYANTLIVGNTMRSVTDKYHVSREKLAYIVDSTAAPVAAIALITTWIGAELGYIDGGLADLQQFPFELTAYAVFLASLKYSFYPILTLIFILMLIRSGKDYGPMLKAERRARTTGDVISHSQSAEEQKLEDLSPVKGAVPRWYNAVIPVSLVIAMTIIGLFHTGSVATAAEMTETFGYAGRSSLFAIWPEMSGLFETNSAGFFTKLGKVIGNADSYVALLWASFSGVVVAILLTVSQRIMKVYDVMHYLVMGLKTMMPAVMILALAWALAITTEELFTADYLSSMLSGRVSPYYLPPITFVLAASIAFSTGSSWSTMAILYPIAIPTTWAVCVANGMPPDIALEILLNVIATVIAASVMGDHCSPISDTTILSSLASDCHHIDHVRTQLPYALTVGSISLVIGTIATMVGGGWLISFLLIAVSILALFAVIHLAGRAIETE